MQEIEALTFEEALKELEHIVKKIDSGTETLDSAVASFERGSALKAYCEQKLQDARLKIEKVVKASQSQPLTTVELKE